MIVPGSVNPLLLRSAAATGYQVSRSLRFNSSDSAYLGRTPSASSTDRKASSYSFWMKLDGRDSAGTQGSNTILSCYDGSSTYALYWNFLSGANGRKLSMSMGGASDFGVTFAPSFRDSSAWYHILIVIDTANATPSDRIRLFVNGVRVTDTSSATWPTQNYQPTTFISGRNTNIGVDFTTSYANYFNGYLADIHFIDGQALTPSSFTEVSATTGQLIPKQYTGSFGTNGFWLKFSDNSAATATTLGKDYSPNGNNWTPNNLSVTAGAGNDSLVDTPTSYGTDTGAGGEVRGNYCTLNPLKGGSPTNGNLEQQNSSPINFGTIGVSSGKWYFETVITTQTSGGIKIGVAQQSATGELGDTATAWAILGQSNVNNGQAINNGSLTSSYTTFAQGDVVNCAFDLDSGKIWWGKNGTWLNSGNPAAGTNAIYSNLSGTLFPAATANQGGYLTWNFGQRPFAYTAPSGFKALCDANLPAPVVAKPSTVMDVKLYTGNDSTQTISGLGFSPDLVWIKARSNTFYHRLYDTIRGTTKALYSNTTETEGLYQSSYENLTAFNSDGFSLGSTSLENGINKNGSTFVAWCWDAGSSTVTNTQGSITSSVRANASAGFSIVTYTGNGSNGATVGHGGLVGLNKGFIIIKSRSIVETWRVGHGALGWTQYMSLSSTGGAGTASTIWNNTAPSSTVITLGTDTSINQNGATYVAYCFAPVAGHSSFGSYVANANSDGPFVYTGFKPRFVLCKLSSAAGADWLIFDTARSPYNVVQANLRPNTSGAEESAFARIDILSNGFKVRAGSGVEPNGTNGNTYIYAAWAELPYQYSRAA